MIARFENLESRMFFSFTLGNAFHTHRFHDADGDRVSVSLTGPGIASVMLGGDATDNADIAGIILASTTRRSHLSVNIRRVGHSPGTMSLGALSDSDPLGGMSLPNVSVDGEIFIGGPVASIDVSAFAQGGDLRVAGGIGHMAVGHIASNAYVFADSFPASVKIGHKYVDPLAFPAIFQGAVPQIEFTRVPAFGSFAPLIGKVLHIRPRGYDLAVYLEVDGGLWTKPYWDDPTTAIASNGSWSTNVTTGGIDQFATDYVVYLIPESYQPPLLSGDGYVPTELAKNAVASATVHRGD